jgi:hypothetical protein
MANVAFMAYDDVDEVCERAIQEMIRRGQLPAQPRSPTATPYFDLTSNGSSRDTSREVYLDPTVNYVLDEIKVPSSNQVIENVEPGTRDELEQELKRLRESLISTQELLIVSEASVRSYKAKLKEFEKLNLNVNNNPINENLNKKINNCICEKLKTEINHLKVEVVSLKCENKSLKSACVSNVTSKLDLDNLPIGQKPNDKTGLGFKKEVGTKPAPSRPKNHTVKREFNQPKSRGSAFLYRDYSKGQSPKSRTFKSFSKNNRFHYLHDFRHIHENNRGVTTERLYKKSPNGYFYEIVDTHVPRKIQPNESKHRTPKHYTNAHQKQSFSNSNNFVKSNNILKSTVFSAKSTEPKLRKIEFSNHYKNHFVKGTEETSKPTCSFCNYCCKTGHISLECLMRKPINSSKFVWMRKDRNSSSSTSNLEVPKST